MPLHALHVLLIGLQTTQGPAVLSVSNGPVRSNHFLMASEAKLPCKQPESIRHLNCLRCSLAISSQVMTEVASSAPLLSAFKETEMEFSPLSPRPPPPPLPRDLSLSIFGGGGADEGAVAAVDCVRGRLAVGSSAASLRAIAAWTFCWTLRVLSEGFVTPWIMFPFRVTWAGAWSKPKAFHFLPTSDCFHGMDPCLSLTWGLTLTHWLVPWLLVMPQRWQLKPSLGLLVPPGSLAIGGLTPVRRASRHSSSFSSGVRAITLLIRL